MIAGLVLGMGGCGGGGERSDVQAVARAVERLGGKAIMVLPDTPDGAATAIRRLDFSHTIIADDDIVRLARLAAGADSPFAAVEEIDLTHTAIGDRSVAVIAAFPAVRKLSLALTRVTDAGLEPLERLERLSDLTLAETSLTDAAVSVLERLGGLRMLVLLRTGVSEAGVARLRRALPEATIVIEPAASRRRQRSPRP